ncbi:MAG: hypothetical protein H0U94_03570 [Acidobacteria bacterium]|nr:hypothetical protein [Acidobacteriota bacterium]
MRRRGDELPPCGIEWWLQSRDASVAKDSIDRRSAAGPVAEASDRYAEARSSGSIVESAAAR